MSDTFSNVMELLVGEPHRRYDLIDLVSSLSARGEETLTGPPPSTEFVRRSIGLHGWRQIVRDMGMAVDPARGNVWSVTLDGLTLELEVVPHGGRDVDVHASVACPSTPDLLVMRRGHALSTEGALATGDAKFDEAVFFASPDATALGACDATTRKALVRFTEGGGFVARGAVRVSDASFDTMSTPQVEVTLSMMMAIAARLEVPRAQRLENLLALIRSDPSPQVRASLRRAFDSHAEVRATAAGRPRGAGAIGDLETTIRDPFADLGARVAALEDLVTHAGAGQRAPLLREIGPELVVPAARAIARGLDERWIAAPVGLALVAYLDHNAALQDGERTQLLGALGRTGDARLASWLVQMLASPRREVAAAALDAIARVSPTPEALVAGMSDDVASTAVALAPAIVQADPSLGPALLLALFDRLPTTAGALRCAYLEALGATRDERAADRVAEELARDDEATRLAAIRALGDVGGPAHVGRLGELGRGVFRASAEKDAARRAVEAIHARIGTHLRGGVAVSQGGAGAVSLADDEA